MTDSDRLGITEPRISTSLLGVATRTAAVDRLMVEHFGAGLDPWQKILMDHVTATGTDGRWCHPYVGALVARQNGKSHAIMGKILDDLHQGRRVVACAQNLDVASQTWSQVADLYDEKEQGPLARHARKVSRSISARTITLHNGGMYRLVAANHKAARGLAAIDTLWMDEVREQRDWRAYNALEPLTTVSPNPQLIMTSNAGDVGSVVLNHFQQQGHEAAATGADALGWLEWSAAPGDTIDDRDGWAAANPNAGRRFPWSVLERAYALAPADVSGWRTERMCQQADALGAVIDGVAWAKWENPDADVSGPCYMTYELDPLRRAAGVYVGNLVDGVVHIRAASTFIADLDKGEQVSDRQVADAVYRVAQQVKPKAIGYMEGTGGAVAAELAPARPRLTLVNMQGQKSARACQLLVDKVRTGGVTHDGDPTLALHVATAVREDNNSGGWWFSRVRSPGPICGATGAALVTYLCLTPTRRGVAVSSNTTAT